MKVDLLIFEYLASNEITSRSIAEMTYNNSDAALKSLRQGCFDGMLSIKPL
jgi:hypothetical protein